jgi:D-tyrosyl-tRNA(Tyr) deacylase
MNLSLDQSMEVLRSANLLTRKRKKGNRPSFIKAARPEQAIPLYEYFMQTLPVLIRQPVKSEFLGDEVTLVNDGPVTILDSKIKNKRHDDSRSPTPGDHWIKT